MTTSMVDWTVALQTATKLVKPGPEISREGAAAVVADLRVCAARAEAYVTEVTGLDVPSATAPVLVVDRPRWIEANLDGFRQVITPLTVKAAEKLTDNNAAMSAIGPMVTGLEIGALLSYLAPKVLGQFDPFFPGDGSLDDPGVGCCWLPPTSWRSSANSTCCRRISGSGSACTRRPTACSSPRCRGCAAT